MPDLNALIDSAKELKQPSAAAAAAYSEHRDSLAQAVTAALSAREDIDRLVGPGNQPMMTDNHRNHARFLASQFNRYHPETLVHSVLWVYRAYRAHGFHLTYWPAQLNAWLDVLHAQVPTELVAEIEPFYDWMLVNQAAFTNLSENPIETPWDDDPHAG